MKNELTLDKLPKYYHKYLKFPMIVEFEDHHQPFMYYAEDIKELGKIFLAVLKNRLAYFYKPEDKEKDEEWLSLEEIDKLPAKYKEDALKTYNNSIDDIRTYEKEKENHEKANKAIKDGNAVLAFECLISRLQDEDEGIEFTPIENIRVK